ncbi:MAG TPA: class A beta-lactamase [Allosphingosinicella sp.]|nr:class A beta-lactamase [Allosphingosinicella sp.]
MAALLIVIGGCSQAEQPKQPAPERTKGAPSQSASKKAPAKPVKPPPPPRAPETSAENQLHDRIRRLGEEFQGDVGIAARDLESGWTAHFNGEEYFPQQSVSKLWVAVALLDRVDRGELDLAEEVTLRRDDLTLFYQPIRPLILRPEGYTTTLGDLLERAITSSDNTANDYLMWRAGGPDAVRRVLATKGIAGVRFGAGERELQSRIAGLQWKPEYSLSRAFFEAREQVPPEKRKAAFESYLEDPMDGATPIGIANALGELEKGQLLSPASTELLLSIMSRTRSGPRRLKGGLRSGWSIAHKTGTGQILGGTQAGYNDVGLITSPDGRTYSVSVLIGRTDRPLAERMALMQKAVEAVIQYHGAKS